MLLLYEVIDRVNMRSLFWPININTFLFYYSDALSDNRVPVINLSCICLIFNGSDVLFFALSHDHHLIIIITTKFLPATSCRSLRLRDIKNHGCRIVVGHIIVMSGRIWASILLKFCFRKRPPSEHP